MNAVQQIASGLTASEGSALVWAGVRSGLITVALPVSFAATVYFRVAVGDPKVRQRIAMRRNRDLKRFGVYDPNRPLLRRFSNVEDRRAHRLIYHREYMQQWRAEKKAKARMMKLQEAQS